MMEQMAILEPVLALLVLSMVVYVMMTAQRVSYISKNPPPAGTKLNVRSAVDPLLDTRTQAVSDNFLNLTEVPVLFYALVFMLYLGQTVDGLYVGLAWLFVVARYAHSAVHCSYNNVMHRFSLHALSCLVLLVMVLRALWQQLGI